KKPANLTELAHLFEKQIKSQKSSASQPVRKQTLSSSESQLKAQQQQVNPSTEEISPLVAVIRNSSLGNLVKVLSSN
ncbi:10486_t:CDS:1, partial [Ambispora gerdemannii]